MNPEEEIRLFKDPQQWDLQIDRRENVFPRSERRSAGWTFVAAGTGLVAAIAVVAVVVVSGIRADHPPISGPGPVTSSAAPQPIEERPSVAVPDDGALLGPDCKYLTAEDTEPAATLGSNVSVPWGVVTMDPDGGAFVIAYVDGRPGSLGCGEHLGSAVVETATSVTITAVNAAGSSADQCTSDAGFGGGWVELSEDIGDRQLIHAPLTAPWTIAPNPLKFLPPVPPVEQEPKPELTYSGTATCKNLFDASTVTRLKSDGYKNSGSAFVDKVAGEPTLEPLYQFLQYGGLVCQWRSGKGSDPVTFAYGPISDTQTRDESEKFGLPELELTGDTRSGYERWLADGDDAGYAIGDGYWAMAYGDNASELLDEIADNAPAF